MVYISQFSSIIVYLMYFFQLKVFKILEGKIFCGIKVSYFFWNHGQGLYLPMRVIPDTCVVTFKDNFLSIFLSHLLLLTSTSTIV